jgi:hypothetical protein
MAPVKLSLLTVRIFHNSIQFWTVKESLLLRRYALALSLIALFACPITVRAQNPPFAQCPAVGQNASCRILIVIEPGGSLRVFTDPNAASTYDGIEDTLIGVVNSSQNSIASIPLRGANPIFSFDGDGICGNDPNTGFPFVPAPPGCPFGPTGYEGPGVSFSNISADQTSGSVSFNPPLGPNGGPGSSTYFGLELAIQTLCPPLTVGGLKQADAPWGTNTYDHDYRLDRDPNNARFSNANVQAVSSAGKMELAVFPAGTGQTPDAPTVYGIDVAAAGANNLNGVRDAINASGASVTASVLTIGAAPNTKYYLSLTKAGVNSIQLRQVAGDATTNALQKISRWGCFLTNSAMIVNYYAIQQNVAFSTDPQILNDWLNDNNGYSGTWVDPTAVVTYAGNNGVHFSFAGKVVGADANDFTLDTYLCSGNPVMLNVTAQSVGDHFVLATGQTTVNGTPTYNINDPGFPRTSLADHYNFAYSGLRLWSSAGTPPSALYVVAHSPVELLVVDPRGKRTGFDPSTQLNLNEIPGSSYGAESLGDDDDPTSGDTTPVVKDFELLTPAAGTYSLVVTGTGNGPYSIDVIAHDFAGKQTRSTINGLAVVGVQSSITLGYSPIPGSQLTINAPCAADVNHDGIVDNSDLTIVKNLLGVRSGQPHYNSAADVNHDGVINILDLAFVSKSLGCKTQSQ